MQQLLHRFVQLDRARVRQADFRIAAALENLRIGNAGNFRFLLLDPFRGHFTNQRRGIADLQFRLHGIAKFGLAVGSLKRDLPAPFRLADGDKFNREIDGDRSPGWHRHALFGFAGARRRVELHLNLGVAGEVRLIVHDGAES